MKWFCAVLNVVVHRLRCIMSRSNHSPGALIHDERDYEEEEEESQGNGLTGIAWFQHAIQSPEVKAKKLVRKEDTIHCWHVFHLHSNNINNVLDHYSSSCSTCNWVGVLHYWNFGCVR